MDSKRLLIAVFALTTKGQKTDPESFAEAVGLTPAEAKQEIAILRKRGMVTVSSGGARLTEKGRSAIKVVFIGGGFEVIHSGHLHTISGAKRLGDALVVSVARDSTIRKRKHREPLTSEKDRVALLSSLRQVDAAILGVEGDIYITLEKVRPDIVALGYDQYHLEKDIEREAARRGMKLKVVRLDSPNPTLKTTKILNEL